MGSLEELAREGKKLTEQEKQAKKARPKPPRKKPLGRTVMGFLSSHPAGWPLMVGAVMGLFGVAFWFVTPWLGVASVAAGLVSLVLMVVVCRRGAAQVRAWRKTLPFKLKPDYTQFLGTNFFQGDSESTPSYADIAVHVRFAQTPDKRLLKDAIKGLKYKGLKVECEYRRLELHGEFRGGAAFHAWFRRFVDEILLEAHAQYGVESVHLQNDWEPDTFIDEAELAD